MKFGERLKKEIIPKYRDFYLDYDGLKEIINEPNNTSYFYFLELILIEFKKINSFVKTVRKFEKESDIDLMKYILLNYIGFYKIFKKYDKQKCQNKKFEFYKIFLHFIKNEQSIKI
jgi:SPX domain protein involved in polyphosphate accumulation